MTRASKTVGRDIPGYQVFSACWFVDENWRAKCAQKRLFPSLILRCTSTFLRLVAETGLLFTGKYFIKGNINYQGILNWILQLLNYHWSKQQKNIKNLTFAEQNIVIYFCPSLYLHQIVLPSPFLTADVFSFWTMYSANF